MSGLVSATSSSLLHGIILLLIMLTSLAAFVASKLADPCEDDFLSELDCSFLSSICFSVINILSCLYSFTIYFLHLIGQCDYVSWSARRKVSLELVCTLGLTCALVGSLVALYTSTMAIKSTIVIAASAFSMASIVLYLLRSGLLLREIRMLWSKPFPSRQASIVSRKTIAGENSNPQEGQSKEGSRKWSRSSVGVRTSVTSSTGPQPKSNDSIKCKSQVGPGPSANSQTVNSITSNDVTELEDEVFLS